MFTCFLFADGSPFALQLIEEARARSAASVPAAGQDGSSVVVYRALVRGYINNEKSFQFVVFDNNTDMPIYQLSVDYIFGNETIVTCEGTRLHRWGIESYFWRSEEGWGSEVCSVVWDGSEWTFPNRAYALRAAIS